MPARRRNPATIEVKPKRDYASSAAAREAWERGDEFYLVDADGGKWRGLPVTRRDLMKSGATSVIIRQGSKARVAVPLHRWNPMRKQDIKFGKMESVSGLWDDDKSSSITVKGEVIGEIVAVAEDYSVTTGSEIRTSGYEVAFLVVGVDDFDKHFEVDRDRLGGVRPGAKSARSVHTDAKNYARKIITENWALFEKGIEAGKRARSQREIMKRNPSKGYRPKKGDRVSVIGMGAGTITTTYKNGRVAIEFDSGDRESFHRTEVRRVNSKTRKKKPADRKKIKRGYGKRRKNAYGSRGWKQIPYGELYAYVKEIPLAQGGMAKAEVHPTTAKGWEWVVWEKSRMRNARYSRVGFGREKNISDAKHEADEQLQETRKIWGGWRSNAKKKATRKKATRKKKPAYPTIDEQIERAEKKGREDALAGREMKSPGGFSMGGAMMVKRAYNAAYREALKRKNPSIKKGDYVKWKPTFGRRAVGAEKPTGVVMRNYGNGMITVKWDSGRTTKVSIDLVERIGTTRKAAKSYETNRRKNPRYTTKKTLRRAIAGSLGRVDPKSYRWTGSKSGISVSGKSDVIAALSKQLRSWGIEFTKTKTGVRVLFSKNVKGSK